jgi:hypothetical protein
MAFLGPALLLAVLLIFGWSWFSTAMDQSDKALRRSVLKSNSFAAKYVAASVTNKLEEYIAAVEEVAKSARFEELVAGTLDDPRLSELLGQMEDKQLTEPAREAAREKFRADPARRPLQERLNELRADANQVRVESWFVNDPRGVQLGRSPEEKTVGQNWGWRTYFNGGIEDRPMDWRPAAHQHIEHMNLSAVYYSLVTDRWTVTISTPIYRDDPDPTTGAGDDSDGRRFLGILGVSVNVDRLLDLPEASDEQFAVLVDWREHPKKGLILQHPLFEKMRTRDREVPPRFQNYRIREAELPEFSAVGVRENYVDPLSRDPEGKAYAMHWLAEAAPVTLRNGDSGFVVIVQESYDAAIGGTLARLRNRLYSTSLVAGIAIVVATTLLWALVVRSLGRRSRPRETATPRASSAH